MVIDLLEQINPHIKNAIHPKRISLSNWKMKVGNITDAPSISFNDKLWTSIRIPFHWGKFDKTYWFRHTIKITPEFAGKPLVLLLDFPEALLYLNGKPFHGIDQHHREVYISEKARLNEQFVIAIQAYSGKKHEHSLFQLADLAVLDTTARRLESGLTVLHEIDKMMEHGSQESRNIRELIRLTLVYLKYFKPGSEEYPNAIKRAYNFLLNTLETEFKTTLPGLVHLIGHSQIDAAWLWRATETVQKCGRTFSTVLRLMEEFPEFKFSQSQPLLYEFTKSQYPELYKQIKQRITEGKWEPLGSMLTEADCNIPGGESLIRQILYGKRYLKQEFGIDSNILWLPESFGFNWALPQILAKSGIKYFYTSKLRSNDTTRFPHTSFWWQGIDGSKILTHISPLLPEGQITPKYISKSGAPPPKHQPVLPVLQTFGYENGGGGPTKESLQFAAVLKTIVGIPASQLSSVQDFFRQIEEQSQNLPLWEDELYCENHRGTFTTQAVVKKENRECEKLLYTTELLLTIGVVFGKPSARQYSHKELEQAWKKLLLNQSQKIIAGTSISAVYKDAANDYRGIRAICNNLISKCIDGISQPVKSGKSEFHFTLFNSLGWARKEYIELTVKSSEKYFSVVNSENKPIPFQVIEKSKNLQKILCFVENIPAFGFLSIIVRPGVKPAEETRPWKTATHGIETPHYKVRFDNKGAISSLYSKHLRRELLQKGKRGNYISTYRDTPKQFEAWNIEADWEKHKTDAWKIKQYKVIEQGPLRAVIRFEYKTASGSTMIQDVRFYHQSQLVDFRTNLKWLEKQTLLKTAFPFNVKSSSAAYEIQYGTINRSSKPRSDFDKAKYEVPAQQWADISDSKFGISILNDCKYGYDANESTLRLTLLRSPNYPNPIDPIHPSEETADHGEHSFNYALYPHNGDWTKGLTVQRAHEFNNPILIFANIKVDGIKPIVESSKPNIIVGAVKKAENNPADQNTDDSIVIRMHEAHGLSTDTTLCFGINATDAFECDLLENNQKEYKIVKSKLSLKFKPFEIKTLKISIKSTGKKK